MYAARTLQVFAANQLTDIGSTVANHSGFTSVQGIDQNTVQIKQTVVVAFNLTFYQQLTTPGCSKG